MGRRPPIPTRTDALFPYTTLFRSCFAQVHQLIYGGRETALRAPATVDALAALAQAGRIAPDIAARLADHYAVLRRIEHRLQMIEDQQTHSLPVRSEEHTSELQSLMRISYAVFCLKKKTKQVHYIIH